MRREHMRIAKVERERFDALAIVKRDDRIITESGFRHGRRWPVFGLKAITSPTVSNSLWRDSRRLAGSADCTGIRMVSLARPSFLLNS